MRPTLLFRGCGESLEGVDIAMIHAMRSTLVHRGCGESLKLRAPQLPAWRPSRSSICYPVLVFFFRV